MLWKILNVGFDDSRDVVSTFIRYFDSKMKMRICSMAFPLVNLWFKSGLPNFYRFIRSNLFG